MHSLDVQTTKRCLEISHYGFNFLCVNDMTLSIFSYVLPTFFGEMGYLPFFSLFY
jgi:hypothetical protein